ncbi:IQ motif and SEC7 domain-containing protein 1-like isoform X1 [Montipora capricornis]|uniref:IQ motif and SEC7 domain-containing protein 1-like isoform X1 n=1 Tax=Montipora capricornis TaxID=246305 RepID=UPI0035F10482
MSSLQSTLEALTSVDSLVGTLKACIWKQDKIIREQKEEIETLKKIVKELDKERRELRSQIANERNNGSTSINTDGSNAAVERDGNEDSEGPSMSTSKENPLSEEGGSTLEVNFSPEHLKSPEITVTTENGYPVQYSPQESPGGTPKLESKETYKPVKRNDSITRQKSFNRKYELSPDLQDRNVRILERQYGGKETAHQAARVIQSYYRKYRMDKQFKRMRTYSGNDSNRKKTNTDPYSEAKTLSPQPRNAGSQVTPVLRIKTKPGGDQRVKSILIIDNINNQSGGEPQMYTGEDLPTDLTSIFTRLENKDSENEQTQARDEKRDLRLASVTNETEHYVKVEIVDNVGSPPEAFHGDTNGSWKVPNGDLTRRQRKGTVDEDGSLYGSDDSGDDMSRRDVSSVDSYDGVCASSGPPSNDDDTLSIYSDFELKPQKLEMRIGINHFNRKPEKGINYLVTHQVLEDDPEMIARFLLTEQGISKQKLGEYLGNLQNEFNMEVLKCFVQALDLTGMEVDEALRLFQTRFILPGEAQKIERLMQEFAEQYVSCNPSSEQGAVDAILILSFAIVMLNTDLHSPNVKRRMTEEQFINNLKGTNNGGDFPEESLLGIYSRIKKKAFVTGKDHVSVVAKLSKKIVGTKSPWTTLAALHRQLRMLTPLYNVRDPDKKEKPHPRTIFLFNDMLVACKERGRAGRGEGIHYYSYKHSFSLCGLKVTTFSNDYYQFGIQVYSKLDSRVLAFFNARDDQTRKVFLEELEDCVEETNEMESDRITTEKQKHLGARFNRSGMDLSRASLTIPKKIKKPSHDTISLIDSGSSIESLNSAGLFGSKQLSSSMLNISEGGEFTSELKKSSSISSLDSAFTDGDSDQTISEHFQRLHTPLTRKGLFGIKWPQRHSSKTLPRRSSPKLSPIAVPTERMVATP